ncbi:MAG: SURF1 family protein [Gemmatimonadetes bacterium]|nr:SURF1 family protein [Gemmatimonadota bacterium]
MTWRTRAFVLTALLAAGTFVRLGFWQVGRLNETRAANAQLFSRRNAEASPLEALLATPDSARFRAVSLSGRYDYDHQLIWTARTRSGAPGVVFLTPMIPDAGGPALLVHRGWAYAADGMQVNDSLWREGVQERVEGFADVFSTGEGPVQVPSVSRGIRRLDFDSLQAMIPYPIARLIAVQQIGAGIQTTVAHPFRLERPTLNEGPHRGYALQWFAFAGITILGTAAVILRERQLQAT